MPAHRWIRVAIVVGVVMALAGCGGGSGGGDEDAYCNAIIRDGRRGFRVIAYLVPTTTDAQLAAAAEAAKSVQGVSEVDTLDHQGAYVEQVEAAAEDDGVTPPASVDAAEPWLRFTADDTAALFGVMGALPTDSVVDTEDTRDDERSMRDLFSEAAQREGYTLIESERLFHPLDPEVAAELRATAPDDVADDLDVALDVLDVHQAVGFDASEAAGRVVDDSYDRC